MGIRKIFENYFSIWQHALKRNTINKFEAVVLRIMVALLVFSNVFMFTRNEEGYYSGYPVIIILDTILIYLLIMMSISILLYHSEFCHKDLFSLKSSSPNCSDLKYFIITTAIQFFLWLPVFLAYYPGLFAYDVPAQIVQWTHGFSTHHPLIHTLYLDFFYYIVGGKILHNYNLGIALATLSQMLLFSLMLSFSHLYFRKIGTKKIWRIILILAAGLLPLFSMLVIAQTKDVFFAGFVGMMVTCMAFVITDINISHKKSFIFLYLLSVVGVILFRNNGIYAVTGALAMEIIIFLKWKKTTLLKQTFIGLLIGILLLIGLKTVLHAKPGSLNEALSIPYQQIACVYRDHTDTLTSSEKEEIIELIPNVEKYNPHKSDAIKKDANIEQNHRKLVKLWVKLGIRYPGSYMKAFMDLNAGNIYLKDDSYSHMYGTQNRQGIFLTDTKKGYDIVHISLFPQLENLYESLYTENNYRYVFGLNILCSPALYLWAILFSMVMLAREKKALPLIAFLFVLILTIIAGPCALPRYILPLTVSLPQVILLNFVIRRDEKR